MAACVKTELDLFSSRPVQLSVIDSQVVGYYPINAVAGKFLEFHIPKSSSVYRDLSSIELMLDVSLNTSKLKVIKAEGNTPERREDVSVSNNLLHSLFDSITVSINNVNVSPNADNYGYKAYIEQLLNYSKPAADTALTSSLFYLDVDKSGKGNFDATKDNLGFAKRQEKIKNGCQLYGRLHLDISTINQLLAMGTDLRIKFQRAKDSFALLSTEANSDVTIDITQAVLFVRNVSPSNSVLLAHAKVLANGGNFSYHLTKSDIKTFAVPANESAVSIDNIVNGRLPKMLAIAFVDNESYSGASDKNPFKLDHFDYSSLTLKVNGVPVPDTFHCNWSANKFCRSYHTLQSESHIKHSNNAHMITPEMYASGYHLVLFDLTPDQSGVQYHSSLPSQGSVRLDVHFSKALPKPITVIAYMSFDVTLEQTATSEIITTDL